MFNGGLATPSGASDAIDCNQARKAELVDKRKKKKINSCPWLFEGIESIRDELMDHR